MLYIKINTIVLMFILAMAGCSNHYRITHELVTWPNTTPKIEIGSIGDKTGRADATLPTEDDINYFKFKLAEYFSSMNIAVLAEDDVEADYTITGDLLHYKKGNVSTRFFPGFGAGKHENLLQMSITDNISGEILFLGHFRSDISSSEQADYESFDKIAKSFVKALKNGIRQLNN